MGGLRLYLYGDAISGAASRLSEGIYRNYRYSSASIYLAGKGVFLVTVMDDIWSDGKW